MNGADHKSGHKTGRRWGVPRERCASYIVPVLLLLLVGGTIVMLEWLYSSGRYNFSVGKPSSRTYTVITPMRYTDMAVTDKLKDMAENAVAGVVVRDAGAPGHLNARLEALRGLNGRTRENLEEFYSSNLLEALRKLPADRREALLLFAEGIGETWFGKIASGDMSISTPERESALLWAEINGLALPVAEENLLYQVMAEAIRFNYRVDPQLTAMVRDNAGNSIAPVERRLETGDVIVERGQVVTPQQARLLRYQGYAEAVFPLTQLIIVGLLMFVLPLWLEISTGGMTNERPSWGCIVFVIGLGWVCEAAAAHLNAAGAGILASVTVAYLCMPHGFAFHVCLVGIASGVFLITGLSVYSTLLLVISSLVASMAGFYVLRKIESREHLVYKVFALAFFLAVAKAPILWLQGYPITWETLRLSPLGETWFMCGRFLFFDLATTFLAVSLLPMIEGYVGAFSVLKMRELSHPSSPLLRKLQTEAPGTYHHCLMIGSLAEAVA
ncbi:MAG: hypothetical protein LBT65_04845, partial [Synergistaceae bacterium]|nr:hypothetical protein [Synergistaceae bacterium]